MAEGADGLVDRVHALLPLLAANARRTEDLRRVAPENIEALTEAGVFRMTVSKHFGGYESSVPTQYEILRLIGTACPSTLVGLDDPDGDDLEPGHVLRRGPGRGPRRARRPRRVGVRARGKATRVDGGVVVTGRWPFNTGCHHAQWAIMAALVDEGDGSPPGIANLLIPYSELEILDDWFATGMTGTGSNTTIGTDVFVPEHRILTLAAQMALDLPTKRNRDNPYYRIPTVPFLIAQAAATPVGIAEGAYAAFMERLPGGRSPTRTTPTSPPRRSPTSRSARRR